MIETRKTIRVTDETWKALKKDKKKLKTTWETYFRVKLGLDKDKTWD